MRVHNKTDHMEKQRRRRKQGSLVRPSLRCRPRGWPSRLKRIRQQFIRAITERPQIIDDLNRRLSEESPVT